MKTLIAVPCLDMVYVDFARSLIDLEKPEGTVYSMVKNSLIYNARNTIAKNAIKHKFDRVLWLDSDIVCEPDTLIKLSEDIDTGLDYVSGVYFMRTMPTKPVIYSDIWMKIEGASVNVGSKTFTNYPSGKEAGLFEIAGSGFGCVMTSVDLLEHMERKYGAPFTPLLGLGEDIAFCWRVKQEGVKMWCDSRVMCGHIGSRIIDVIDYEYSSQE